VSGVLKASCHSSDSVRSEEGGKTLVNWRDGFDISVFHLKPKEEEEEEEEEYDDDDDDDDEDV